MVNQRNIRKLSHSQNFLKSSEFVENLIVKADINQDDLVVEIGPGNGIITKILAKKADRVITVELDSHLASNLNNKFKKSSNNVNIIQADFLKWRLPKEPFKVFSNIPFNLTTDIIKKLTQNDQLTEAYLIVQDKAAQRFTGQPKETQVSILLKPWFNLTIILKISKEQFTPKPNVNAVLLKIERRSKPLVDSDKTQQFKDFVIYGFNQWKPNIIEAFDKVLSNTQKSVIKSK
jgi:23S rRNA (adenine-N6)-dimethyltransferase